MYMWVHASVWGLLFVPIYTLETFFIFLHMFTEDDTTIYGGNGTPDINVMEGYVEDDLSDSISSGLDIFDEPPDNSIVKVNATRKKFKLASHIKQIKGEIILNPLRLILYVLATHIGILQNSFGTSVSRK